MRQRGVANTDGGGLAAQSLTASGKARDETESSGCAPAFQLATWAVFVAQVWLLDFGRPIFALYLSNGSLLFQLSISESSDHSA